MTSTNDVDKLHIPYYSSYLPSSVIARAIAENGTTNAKSKLLEGFVMLSPPSKLDTPEALKFVCSIYDTVKDALKILLEQRSVDRNYIDCNSRMCTDINISLQSTTNMRTVFTLKDKQGRIVWGPNPSNANGETVTDKKVVAIPQHLEHSYVALMSASEATEDITQLASKSLPNEPNVVSELCQNTNIVPKYLNMSACGAQQKSVSNSIRFVRSIGLPSTTHYYNRNPIPLHIYDICLHLFYNWENTNNLTLIISSLENEEEAAYIKVLLDTCEKLLQQSHAQYKPGSVRLLVEIDNIRAIFRASEIADELHPFFVGYLFDSNKYFASAIRFFKEDSHYKTMLDSDSSYKFQCLHTAQQHLATVAKAKGAISLGKCMLSPTSTEIYDGAMEYTISELIKESIVVLKSGTSGVAVAHPNFIRISIALVEAWKCKTSGNEQPIVDLIKGLVKQPLQQTMLTDLLCTDKMQNVDCCISQDELQAAILNGLQIICNLLAGSSSTLLSNFTNNYNSRIVGDVTTLERIRWALWEAVQQEQVSLVSFLTTVQQEMFDIKSGATKGGHITVEWDHKHNKWYPVAMRILLKLVSDKQPVEFVQELLCAFYTSTIKHAADPWQRAASIEPAKYCIHSCVTRFNMFFACCGCSEFAAKMAETCAPSAAQVEAEIMKLNGKQVAAALEFVPRPSIFSTSADLQSLVAKYKHIFNLNYATKLSGNEQDMLIELRIRLRSFQSAELETSRKVLAHVAKAKLAETASSFEIQIQQHLNDCSVNGASIAISTCPTITTNNVIQTFAVGLATASANEPVTANTLFQLGAISNSIAAAFAIDYFEAQEISLDEPVNHLLSQAQSSYQIPVAVGGSETWANEVTIRHLLNHTAFAAYPAKGICLTHKMPSVQHLIEGKYQEEYGYKKLEVTSKPGSQFCFGYAGYMVLQVLLEARIKKPIGDILQCYLAELNLGEDITFESHSIPNKQYATGYKDVNTSIAFSRQMLPALSTGGYGTAKGVLKLTLALQRAYRLSFQRCPLSHDTSVNMVHFLHNLDTQMFMGTEYGLGTFVAKAGPNRVAVHHTGISNSGYCGLYATCVAGPNEGSGFSILCNGNSTRCVAIMAREALKMLQWQGVDYSYLAKPLSKQQSYSESLFYRNHIFKAFTKDVAELTNMPTKPDALLEKYNALHGSELVYCTNDGFAPASNLIASHIPNFDPTAFGRHGKIMDSWESVRHNFFVRGRDMAEFKLQQDVTGLKYLMLSTQYHDGNHAQFASVDVRNKQTNEWVTVISKMALKGHSIHRCTLQSLHKKLSVDSVRIFIYPDGGLSRCALYTDSNKIPEEEANKFPKSFEDGPTIERVAVNIPPVVKAQFVARDSLSVAPSEAIAKWQKQREGTLIDVASTTFGSKIIEASNEHYGPAIAIISPYTPQGMFDGLESARSSNRDNVEFATVQFLIPVAIEFIEVDFTYFVNNNPHSMSIIARETETSAWETLVEKCYVKPYAGNVKVFNIGSKSKEKKEYAQVKVLCYPDGGFNRVHIYTRFTNQQRIALMANAM